LSTSEPSSERLALLYQLSQTFNSSLDLDQVLNTVMDEVVATLHAERGFVVLREQGGSLVFRAARGIDHTTINDPQFQISRGVVDQVLQEGKALFASDAQHDPRFSSRQSVLFLGLRSILCAPLKVKENIFGAIYVDNRLQAGIFSPADLELLSAIASTAAIAIENARLYQLAVEKGRLERELQLARRVQASLIPHDCPYLPGWEFAARWIPARQVAGDFYDFFLPEKGGLSLVIADVADKGIASALFMANSRSILRASMVRAASSSQGVQDANCLICADASDGMFLTLVYCRIDPILDKLTYVNAGHNSPMLYRSREDQFEELGRTGMAIGVDEEAIYDQKSTSLRPGDFIFFYTDGVIDANEDQENRFGLQRLEGVLFAHRYASAEGIATGIDGALKDFAGAAAPYDDVTILVAKRV